MPSNRPNRPIGPLSSMCFIPLRGCLARLPPPSTKKTSARSADHGRGRRAASAFPHRSPRRDRCSPWTTRPRPGRRWYRRSRRRPPLAPTRPRGSAPRSHRTPTSDPGSRSACMRSRAVMRPLSRTAATASERAESERSPRASSRASIRFWSTSCARPPGLARIDGMLLLRAERARHPLEHRQDPAPSLHGSMMSSNANVRPARRPEARSRMPSAYSLRIASASPGDSAARISFRRTR